MWRNILICTSLHSQALHLILVTLVTSLDLLGNFPCPHDTKHFYLLYSYQAVCIVVLHAINVTKKIGTYGFFSPLEGRKGLLRFFLDCSIL